MVRSVALTLVALVAFLVSCVPQAPPQAVNPAPTAKPSVPAATDQQREWDNLVAEARKEGRLVIYSDFNPQARQAATSGFKDKYGIEVEFVSGRGAESAARIRRETEAGIHNVDIGNIGPNPTIPDIKPMGILQPIEPLLMLPEVTDSRQWIAGHLPYIDKDKTIIAISMSAMPFYVINTKMAKQGEIKGAPDLLDPKWKGKIALNDPSVSSNSNLWFTHMFLNVMGEEKATRFMKELVAQEPVISRDQRLQIEWIARDKYPILVGASPKEVVEFIKVGAPVAFAEVAEPRVIHPGSANLTAFKGAPHPAAQKLFVNWALSKEGNGLIVPALGYPSLRVDGTSEGVLKDLVPKANDIADTEEQELAQGPMRTIAAQILAPLLK